ncbi:phage tail protein [Methylobacterium symbioticum]|uniref:Phage tail collar domain-containing protein n=1 Tax=Methylobacterium symbioticum TaxID=2584084 RepID=A0A509EDZ2_9HYPH|nr:tail fiber protein [Methylobacterium symbioticum]VUD71794.1 hypothetical protein MET9862_02382 [Methylobacterium symbioticum]
MTGLIDFSPDASSNDVAAAPIFFGEGQPAATINNSARELMAALARWRDDNVGTLTAIRGSGDVYAIATSQVFKVASGDVAGTNTTGHTLSFVVNVTNQGPVRLAPDGCPAKSLRRHLARELGPGDLIPNVVYRVAYIPYLDFYVVVSPTIERPGRIAIQADINADSGWVPCDGRQVSRVSYAALFAAIGSAYGNGDGSTTFNVPNFNGGRAPMGPGLSGAGGISGTLGSSGGSETVTLTEAQIPPHGHGGSISGAGGHDHGGTVTAAGQHSHGGGTGAAGGHGHTGSTAAAGGHAHSGTTASGGGHIHPIKFDRAGIYTTGGGGIAVSNIFPNGSNSGGVTDDNGTNSGAHQHALQIDGVGDHAHAFTTDGVGDHAHSIVADGSHQHSIPGVGDHSHALTINPTGGGGAHSNMPPGLVVAFVIKA